LGSGKLSSPSDHEKRRVWYIFKTSITNGTVHIVGYAVDEDTLLIQMGKYGSESSLNVLQHMLDGLNL
jgi:hypothetical protein